jgi:hypothetical protein
MIQNLSKKILEESSHFKQAKNVHLYIFMLKSQKVVFLQEQIMLFHFLS